MPHISRQFLKGDKEHRLVQALLNTLTIKGTAARREQITRELLTGVERLMLAKRLSIVVLLARGVSVDAIADTLKVSPSTVSRLRAAVENGKFVETLRAAKHNKTDNTVLLLFRTFLLGPRQRHAPRWQWLNDL